MAQPTMQHAFHAGEWAPALNARVDLAKYHSAAALLRNFFVDYRGGASTRTGSRYILQTYKTNTGNPPRVITFQASFTVGYVLEVGDRYIRFYNNGAPVIETGLNITAVTKANPAVVSVANTYAVGDWVYITGVVGMTQLNGNYYIISARSAGTITLSDLNGVAIDSTGYGTWTSGGTTQRVYTIVSPYAAADVALLKFAQNVNAMVLTHPSYVPYVLTLNSATSWTLLPIIFGSSITTPANVVASTTLGAGTVNYAYIVTAVDANGQESSPSAPGVLASKLDLRTVAGTNSVTWTAVPGAVSYNVYKAEPVYSNPVAAGAQYGFAGNCTGVTFADSNIGQDFSSGPPVPQNPFQGAGVQSVAITSAGTYTTVPVATAAAAPTGGQTATLQAVLQVTVATLNAPGSGNNSSVGEVLVPSATAGLGNLQVQVTTVNGSNQVTGIALIAPGGLLSGVTPTNPVGFNRTTNGILVCNINLTWGIGIVGVISPGSGYLAAPAISFSSGAATATATLATASAGNPGVPSFFQQRMVLAGLTKAPQSFYMSQPGSYYNFNISNPIEPDDAISAAIVSGQLNTIKSMSSMPAGMIMLSDKAAWLINGGSAGSAVSPESIVANAQAYNGSSDVPPIIANSDLLYVQAKGSIVRYLVFNYYAQVYTGTDISVLSSHLFYGFQILQWAWAEEPFKVVWTIRDDGTMLTLTFMKEQELIGWAHSDTTGLYQSVTVCTEAITDFGDVDAVYNVTQRTINGNTVQYIERFAERILTDGDPTYAWCVDAGIQYQGAPATTFTGAQHLAAATVTGLADGVVIPPFTMPTTGTFILGTAASVVTVGLAFLPQLQTLAIDLGEPTAQGKRKKISAVTVRVEDTLGLSMGSTFTNLVPMKDLVVGNVGSATNTVVTGLVTADARTILDPTWTVPGQYCIEQPFPLPATILGVIPEVTVGDTPK
jgi:hypothetical protein